MHNEMRVFTSPEFLTKKIKGGKATGKKTTSKPLAVVNLGDSDSDDFVPAVPKRGNARGNKARGNKENVLDSDDPFKEKSRKRKTTKEPPKEKKRECHDILEMFRKGQKKGSSYRKNQERGTRPPAPISAGSSPVSKKQRQSTPASAARGKTPPADAPPEIAPEEAAPPPDFEGALYDENLFNVSFEVII
jgi:hypothetical protein